MSEHRDTTGTELQPRWRSKANQARFCALLALMLAGCQTEPGQAVSKFWDRAWGPATEGRPAPPNANAPFPNLGTVPPRPEAPDAASRDALAAGLVQQREASRVPLGALPGAVPRLGPPPPALAPAFAGMAIPAPATPAEPAAPTATPQPAAPAPVAAPEPSGIPAPPVIAPAGAPPPPVLRDAPRRP